MRSRQSETHSHIGTTIKAIKETSIRESARCTWIRMMIRTATPSAEKAYQNMMIKMHSRLET